MFWKEEIKLEKEKTYCGKERFLSWKGEIYILEERHLSYGREMFVIERSDLRYDDQSYDKIHYVFTCRCCCRNYRFV